MPDIADEEFWQEFNQKLWLLVKEAEPSAIKTAAADLSVSFKELKEIKDYVSPEHLRKKECLSFERYNEIAENPTNITFAEKAHLEHCRYCERRITAFAELLTPPIEDTTPEVFPMPTRKTWRERFFFTIENGFDFKLQPLNVGLAALAIFLTFGFVLFLIQSANKPNEETAVSTENTENFKQNAQNQTNLARETNKNNESFANTNAEIRPRNQVKKEVLPNIRNKKQEKEIVPESKKPIKTTPSELELAQLPSRDREAVRESLQTGEIPLSEDLALLQLNLDTRGKKENIETANSISPKGEATLETSPNFRWQAAENSEYKIFVTDRAFREVAESKTLSQNNWQIEKELSPGFYFWQIGVRQKGEKEETPFSKTARRMMFKVLSRTEKRQIETAVKSTKSNLVRAILYARAGLLEKAEIELNAELDKHPNSSKARKLLTQVQIWRRK